MNLEPLQLYSEVLPGQAVMSGTCHLCLTVPDGKGHGYAAVSSWPISGYQQTMIFRPLRAASAITTANPTGPVAPSVCGPWTSLEQFFSCWSPLTPQGLPQVCVSRVLAENSVWGRHLTMSV